MPKPSVSTASRVNAGLRNKPRTACLNSVCTAQSACMLSAYVFLLRLRCALHKARQKLNLIKSMACSFDVDFDVSKTLLRAQTQLKSVRLRGNDGH